MIEEVWRDIKDYEGLYQMSNKSNIKRIIGYGCLKERILKQTKAGAGYSKVILTKNGKQKTYLVHRLMADIFPELIEIKDEFKYIPVSQMEINHKDEDKNNNLPENLEWCPHWYNMEYGNRKEITRSKKTGVYNTKKSKPVLQYTLEGQFVSEYPSAAEAERQTGIYNGNIIQCCKGNKNYSHAGGYKWMYSQNNLSIKFKSHEK